MSDDPVSQKKLDAKLVLITDQLAEISKRIAGGPRPADPQTATHYDHSLYWLISHLSEAVHGLNGFMQVLIRRIEDVREDVNRKDGTYQALLQGITNLTAVNQNILTQLDDIDKSVDIIHPKEPLLMRNLWWIPTDAVEIGLIGFLLMDCAAFSLRSDTLVNSALFRQLSGLNEDPRAWGVAFGVSAIGMILSFFSRQRKLRRMAVCVCFVLLGGIATRALGSPDGIPLGGAHHLLAALGAAWVLSRGPSNAI
jgi:hypothetical protein